MAGTSVKLTSHKDERLKEISAQLKAGMNKACILVQRDAKINAPVDTGRLANSIERRLDIEGDQLVGIVGTKVEYASFVEFGTIRMAAQPFLFPALESNKNEIKDLLKE